MVCVFTVTKLPLTKYTPSFTEKAAPVAVASADIVVAKVSPAGMKVLFSTPDNMSIFVIKFSPSSKSSKSVVISPDDSY